MGVTYLLNVRQMGYNLAKSITILRTFTVVLMALVDSNYRFIWGSCEFPGNSHDAIIFQSNELWSNIKDNDIIVLACMVLH